MKILSAKICHKNISHEAKLASGFPTNFLLRETNLSPALPAFWEWVSLGEKLGVRYLCFKIRIEMNQAGKGYKGYFIQYNI